MRKQPSAPILEGALPPFAKLFLCIFLIAATSICGAQQVPPPDSSSQSKPGNTPDSSAQSQSSSSAPSAAAAPNPAKLEEDERCQHPADPHRRHHGCEEKHFGWDETLAGGWGGVRDVMKKAGITPTLSYIAAPQTNATGGPHQVWGYAGLLSVSFGFDLNKLFKVPGFSAYADLSWGTGSNLSATIRSSLQVNTIYAPGFFLGEMYLEQDFLDGNLQFFGGRLGAANTFANLPIFADYVDYGINPGPVSIGTNDPPFLSPPPGSEWGLQTVYKVKPSVQVAAGMFNTNLYSANGSNHGADFDLQQGNKGALVLAEVDYFYSQGTGEKEKPGEYTVGFIHDNNSFPIVGDPSRRSDTYTGTYIMGQQTVYRPGGVATATQGLTVWGAWAYDANQLICPMPMFWGAGASYEGLLAARKRDIVSTGWVTGRVSSLIPNATGEQLFELNYQWRHSQYLIITPHFEYIWKPSGYDVPGAAVFGLQVSLTL